MIQNNQNKPTAFGSTRREPVKVSGQDLVDTELLPGNAYPLVVRPRVSGLSLESWTESNIALIDSWLQQYGALLFRGFNEVSLDGFDKFVTATSGPPIPYSERSSPREQVQDHIYTSTSHPAEEEIFLHNEQSYNLRFPLRIYFHCVEPADIGGATTISDTRLVYKTLPPDVVQNFARRGYTYLRNYGQGFGLPWEVAFQTENRVDVEQYCVDNEIEFEWRDQGRLRTRQVRRCIALHPGSKEQAWFNHATFFNVTTLAPLLVKELRTNYSDEQLPNHTLYGDGEPIEPAVLECLRETYSRGKVSVIWERGDTLMLDNMLMAHGRESFSGPRKVVVAMSKVVSWNDVVVH